MHVRRCVPMAIVMQFVSKFIEFSGHQFVYKLAHECFSSGDHLMTSCTDKMRCIRYGLFLLIHVQRLLILHYKLICKLSE